MRINPPPQRLEKTRRSSSARVAHDNIRPRKRKGSRKGSLLFSSNKDAKRWRTLRGDIDIAAMSAKIMQLVPQWALHEREAGKGDKQHEIVLRQFFHRPDGENPCQAILQATVARLHLTGTAHWHLLRAEMNEEETRETLYDVLLRTIRPVLGADKPVELLAKQVEQALETFEQVPLVGFELLAGDIERKEVDGEEKWVQTLEVSAGSSTLTSKQKTYPLQDVVQFTRIGPDGKPLALIDIVEPWSDASGYLFVTNRSAAKHAGMADLMLIFSGISEDERQRLKEQLEIRADPNSIEDMYLPIIARMSAPPGEKVVAQPVKLGDRILDAAWSRFDEMLLRRKSGLMGVPLGTIGAYREVNRANMEAQRHILYEETLPTLLMIISDTVTERIIVNEFGFEDWIFDFEPADLRTEEVRHVQRIESLRAGLTTPYQAWVQLHGKHIADEFVRTLESMGVNGDVFKVPWIQSGGNWMPISAAVQAVMASEEGESKRGR